MEQFQEDKEQYSCNKTERVRSPEEQVKELVSRIEKDDDFSYCKRHVENLIELLGE